MSLKSSPRVARCACPVKANRSRILTSLLLPHLLLLAACVTAPDSTGSPSRAPGASVSSAVKADGAGEADAARRLPADQGGPDRSATAGSGEGDAPESSSTEASGSPGHGGSSVPASTDPLSGAETTGAAAEPKGLDRVSGTAETAAIDGSSQADTPEESPDPVATQQEALELCQSAAEFLDQGAVEDALAALDRAYELMLELPSNGDAAYLQAKDDIRRMVAELISGVYRSQQAVADTPRTSWDLELPIVSNEHVAREIRSYTTVERETFLAAYRRSGRFRSMILEKLDAAGLPSQLSWLPLVESEFKTRALSRAGAFGLWQFISSTGQRFGLGRDAWVDERLDPYKATDAAIAYLTELHGLFGDWPKALAAYNCGEARVMRLQRRQPDQYLDFWDLYELLPRETRRYVPRLLAALLILESPEQYGMTLPEPDEPTEPWATARINRSVKLDRLAATVQLEPERLIALNPELRHAATPDRSYELRAPRGVEGMVLERISDVAVWSPPRPQTITHRVRRGETLSAIARRYGSSVGAIMRQNRLRSANRIWPGQRLGVPVRGASSAPSYNPAEGTHTVRRGDSLYTITRRYNTTVAELKRINELGSNLIRAGQSLKVHPGSRADLRRYQVRRGDTLGAIATANRVSLSALLRVNGLGRRSTIYPGQWLVIPE